MGTNGIMGYLDARTTRTVTVVSLSGLGLLMSALGLWVYRLAIFDTLLFFAAVLILFYVPGKLLVTSTGLRASNGLTLPVLSLGAGSVAVPVFYRFLRMAGTPDFLIMAAFGLLLVIWLYLQTKILRKPPTTGNFSLPDVWACLLLILFVLCLLHLSHFLDVILEKDGFLFRAHHMSESVFHLGLINALSDGYPPPALYASGSPDFASYHLNMHLQTELLVRLFGLESLRLVSFYMPLLYFVLLVFLPYVFVREIGGSPLTGLVAAALIFGSDFSFVATMLTDSGSGEAWITIFQTTIWSLFTLNGFIPGLIALFICVILLRDYLEKGNQRKLVVFALMAYGAFGFKSSMGFQIGAAACGTGVLMAIYGSERHKGALLAIFSGLASLIMCLDLILLRSSVGNNTVLFAPLNYFQSTIEKLGLSEITLDWVIPLLLITLISGLGVRVLSVPFLLKRVKMGGETNWFFAFIGLFFLLGYLVSELFFIGNSAGQNNAYWFYYQSLMAVWFLFFSFLVYLEHKKWVYPAVSALAIVMSVPSTAQFLELRNDDHYLAFDQEALTFVETMRETKPESVFLHPLNSNGPSLASNFAGRMTVLSVWLSFVTQNEDLAKRASDVQFFFAKETVSSERLDILARYKVNYVYGPKSKLGFMKDLVQAQVELKGENLVLYRIDKLH